MYQCSSVTNGPGEGRQFHGTACGLPSSTKRYTSAMLRGFLLFAFVISPSLAFGQLDSNSVTVTASSSASLSPDQIVFTVVVSAPVDKTLDDVTSALAGSGITTANFTGVSVYSSQPSIPAYILTWEFNVPVAFSQMQTEVAALTALQKTIAQMNNGMSLQFTAQGTQVSTQLQQSQTCSVPALIATATSQAQALAAAADFSVGNIVKMSSVTSSSPVCTMTVEFQLLGVS